MGQYFKSLFNISRAQGHGVQNTCTQVVAKILRIVTTDKGVALQCGHGENHARAAEKSRKLRGGAVAVCVLYMCVSGYAVCS